MWRACWVDLSIACQALSWWHGNTPTCHITVMNDMHASLHASQLHHNLLGASASRVYPCYVLRTLSGLAYSNCSRVQHLHEPSVTACMLPTGWFQDHQTSQCSLSLPTSYWWHYRCWGWRVIGPWFDWFSTPEHPLTNQFGQLYRLWVSNCIATVAV